MASVDGLISGASGVFAAVTIGSGLVRNRLLMIALMLLGGAAWMIVLSSLNVAARMVVPAWVQARSVAIYLLVFQGGTAMGSLAWGAVAGRWCIRSTLEAAGVGLIAGAATTLVFPLPREDSLDLRPAADWPEPNISGELDIEKGPTFVTVEYCIDPLNAEELSELWLTCVGSAAETGPCIGGCSSTQLIAGGSWKSSSSSHGWSICASPNAPRFPTGNCRRISGCYIPPPRRHMLLTTSRQVDPYALLML